MHTPTADSPDLINYTIKEDPRFTPYSWVILSDLQNGDLSVHILNWFHNHIQPFAGKLADVCGPQFFDQLLIEVLNWVGDGSYMQTLEECVHANTGADFNAQIWKLAGYFDKDFNKNNAHFGMPKTTLSPTMNFPEQANLHFAILQSTFQTMQGIIKKN
jgi:hypothetical protein